MKIAATNICRFKEFAVELNGITVIAGVNSGGKTTIGKTLYAAAKCESFLLQNLVQQKIKIVDDLTDSFSIQLYMAENRNSEARTERLNEKQISAKITKIREMREKSTNLGFAEFNLMVDETITLLNDPQFRKISMRLFPPSNPDAYFGEALELLNSPLTSEISDYNRKLIEYVFESEFGEQLANITCKNKPSKILFDTNNRISEIEFNENRCTSFIFRQGEKAVKNLIYIDDIYILEKQNKKYVRNEQPPRILKPSKHNNEYVSVAPYSFDFDHSEDMSSILELTKRSDKRNMVHEMSTDKYIAPIKQNISNLINGGITYSEESNAYIFTQNGYEYLLKNTSSGTKSLAIIELLLRNGLINNTSILIIDEPETHLHPEWQVKFAEILVFIAKATEAKVLISTHSPYFVEAVETYSISTNFTENTKFYTIELEDTFYSSIQDVTDDTSIIFDSLAKPYTELDNVFKDLLK